MNNKSATMTNNSSTLGNIVGWFFGIVVLAIGVVNLFWGNDPEFGVFLLLLSFVFFPPVNDIVRKRFGFTIPLVIKIILAAFIIWAALGVGELFDKIDLMTKDL